MKTLTERKTLHYIVFGTKQRMAALNVPLEEAYNSLLNNLPETFKPNLTHFPAGELLRLVKEEIRRIDKQENKERGR